MMEADKFDWKGYRTDGCEIPSHMMNELEQYFKKGELPGVFLTKVLEHDLLGACHRADKASRKNLVAFTKFLHNVLPSGCHGSTAHVRAWSELGGRCGMGSDSKKWANLSYLTKKYAVASKWTTVDFALRMHFKDGCTEETFVFRMPDTGISSLNHEIALESAMEWAERIVAIHKPKTHELVPAFTDSY